jgi:hypothetical protein
MYCDGRQYGSAHRGSMHICAGCMDQRERAKTIAHRAVKKAVLSGELESATTQYCVDCGAFAAILDHRSYHEPLKVDPVCHRCNQLRGPGFWAPK